MMISVADLTEVWTPASILFAASCGVLLGLLAIGKYSSDPAYASGESTPLEYGLLVAVLCAAIGLVFFGFQIIGTYVAADPEWTRVVSRLGLWLLYAGAIGLGTYVRLTWHVSRKHTEARENAARELDDR